MQEAFGPHVAIALGSIKIIDAVLAAQPRKKFNPSSRSLPSNIALRLA
jgi:hypothetical protein